MSGRRSRRKGHDFERAMVQRFREVFGEDHVRRGLQSRSGEEVPDLEVPVFWPELKRGKKPNIRAALEQATAAASKGRIPIAVCKDDRAKPTVTLSLDDFLELVREWWQLSKR